MRKKLYRVRRERMLTGVCGGIAEYFNMDPTIVRMLWFFITLCAGAGVLAYIVCSFIIPEKCDDVIDVTN